MSRSISQSSVSISTQIPSAADVAGSHPRSDSLWGSDSGAMAGTVIFSSGSGSLSMEDGHCLSVGGSSKVSAVEGVDGLGFGSGCVLDWG